VAPNETTKLLGRLVFLMRWAILPAATDDLHLNGDAPYFSPHLGGTEEVIKSQALDRSLSKTESGLQVRATKKSKS